MNTAFIFNGALTAAQEASIAECDGIRVGPHDYLNDFDLVVLGRGVMVETDAETVDYSEYSPQPPKSEAADVVISDEELEEDSDDAA